MANLKEISSVTETSNDINLLENAYRELNDYAEFLENIIREIADELNGD